jgi:hypothetical protein
VGGQKLTARKGLILSQKLQQKNFQKDDFLILFLNLKTHIFSYKII